MQTVVRESQEVDPGNIALKIPRDRSESDIQDSNKIAYVVVLQIITSLAAGILTQRRVSL